MHPEQKKQIQMIAQKYNMPESKVLELLMPPEGRKFVLDGLLYSINYVNKKKGRISADFVGVYKKEKNKSWLDKVKGVFNGKNTSSRRSSRSPLSSPASIGEK